MDKRLPNEHAWSRRLADWENGPEGPSPDAAVWDRLERSLDKKKRRPLAAWWLAGLCLFGILMVAFLDSRDSSNATFDATGSFEIQSEQLVVEEEESLEKPGAHEPAEIVTANSYEQAVDVQEVSRGLSLAVPGLPPVVASSSADTSIVANRVSFFEATPLSDKEEKSGDAPSARAGSVPRLDHTLRHTVTAIHSSVEVPIVSDVSKQEGLIPPDLSIRGRSPVVSIGLQAAFHQPEVRVQIPSSTLRAQSISRRIAHSTGVRMRVEMGNRWSLITGLSLGREASEHQMIFVRLYRPDLEVLDPNGNARTTYQTDFATDYSKAGTDIEIVRPVDTDLPANYLLRFGVIAQEEVRTISVPLLLAYDRPLNKWLRIRLAAGLAWNRQDIRLKIQSRISNPRGLNIWQSRVRTNEQFLDQNYWTGQLQAGIAIRPHNRWEFVLSPQFSTSLTKLGEDGNLNVRFRQASLMGGVYYRFE